ncbi:MAG TPA: glycosyltransferase [Thermoleophilaceae bacterium]
MADQPDIAVVVPSHDRPLRLRWLLNALEEQTLPRERFEVIVAHDSRGPETAELLRTHPLGVRAIGFEPGPGPAAKRNAGWHAATAPLVAFTDDDCRPPPEWLERALAAARAHPGAIVQGATIPDPDEEHLVRAAPHVDTQRIVPPTPWAQTSNIVYPRELLERVGGFDETFPLAAGEDTDLAIRATEAGAGYVGARDVVTFHAVHAVSLPQLVRARWRWQHLAYLVKRQPSVREHFPMWIFWKRTHVWLPLAIAGALLRRRKPGAELLALPWVIHTLPDRGAGPRGRARALSELPARAVVDSAEMAALARGSIRWRTFFL